MKKVNMFLAGGIAGAFVIFVSASAAILVGGSGVADAGEVSATNKQISPGLVLPRMDPVEGKMLFASKGCVVCHAVNGVGGTDAPAIDASTMSPLMSPFDFFAKMWDHSQGMIAMQQMELGGQVTFTGQEIANIIAFLHDADVQKTFTTDDIPPAVKAHLEGDNSDSGEMNNGSGSTMMNGQGTMGGQSGSMMNQQNGTNK